jgi:hypothetical protein
VARSPQHNWLQLNPIVKVRPEHHISAQWQADTLKGELKSRYKFCRMGPQVAVRCFDFARPPLYCSSSCSSGEPADVITSGSFHVIGGSLGPVTGVLLSLSRAGSVRNHGLTSNLMPTMDHKVHIDMFKKWIYVFARSASTLPPARYLRLRAVRGGRLPRMRPFTGRRAVVANVIVDIHTSLPYSTARG